MINWNLQIALGIIYLLFDAIVIGTLWLIFKIREFMKNEEAWNIAFSFYAKYTYTIMRKRDNNKLMIVFINLSYPLFQKIEVI